MGTLRRLDSVDIFLAINSLLPYGAKSWNIGRVETMVCCSLICKYSGFSNSTGNHIRWNALGVTEFKESRSESQSLGTVTYGGRIEFFPAITSY